jgi:hypothetical protein
VVEAEEVQHGGVPVVDVHGVLDGFVADLVGGSIGEAAFDAAVVHLDGVVCVGLVPALNPRFSSRCGAKPSWQAVV